MLISIINLVILLAVLGLVIYIVVKNKVEKYVPFGYKNVYKNIIPPSQPSSQPSSQLSPQLSSLKDMFLSMNDSMSRNDFQKQYDELLGKVNSYVPKKNGKDSNGNQILESDEFYVKLCCQLALRSVKMGNFGIGCVITDPTNSLKPQLKGATVMVGTRKMNYMDFIHKILLTLGYTDSEIKSGPYSKYFSKIVGIGLNQIFNYGFFGDSTPHVRSDRHGEMVAMDMLENAISTVAYEKDFQIRMPEGLTLYTQLESCPMCMARLASSSISTVLHGAADNGGGMVHKLCDLPPIFIGLTSVQKFAPSKISSMGPTKGSVGGLVDLCNQCFGINVGVVGTKQNNRAYGCQEKCPSFNYCRPTTSPDMIARMETDASGFTRY